MSKRHLVTAAGLAALGVVALAGPAAAHVTPSVTSAPAGSYLKFDLRVPHGCGEAATDQVEVKIPDGINSVTPQVVPGWTIERTIVPLDPPLDDGHGGQLTERTAVITWTGGPLAHDQLEEFGLSVKLPDTPGETLAFPVVQTCEGGTTTAWIEVPEEGKDEPDHPAPVIELTASTGDGHGSSSDDAEAEEEAAAPASTSSDHDSSATPLAVAGIALGAAGLAVGGTALRTTKRKAG